MRMIGFGLWAIILFWNAPAHAQSTPLYTTSYLQSLCNSPYDVDVGLCSGYIMGVADTLQAQRQVCLTTKIGPETLLDNLRRAWAQKSDQPVNALQSVQQILQGRFPCP